MKYYFIPLALVVLTVSCAHHSTAREPSSFDGLVTACQRRSDCELEIFETLSRAYRPSKEEKALHDAIQELFLNAKAQIWNNSANVTSESDAVGNLLIRLPATGAFVGTQHSSVALQSHMDMVLAVKDSKPGEDLRPYFKNGVDVEETDGWLHSKGYKTTLGADDLIGGAISLRYLLDPTLSHPPLELVFTVDEESGMTGARNIALPLQSSELINIDSPDPTGGLITIGSMGGKKSGISGVVTLEKLPPGMSALSIKLSGLRGGHSGIDIWMDRVNAIQAFATILATYMKAHHDVWLLGVTSGGVLNQIPTSFEATIAVPTSEMTQTEEMKTAARNIVLRHKDEEHNPEKTALSIHQVSGDVKGNGLSPERLARLLHSLRAIPNGVIKRNKQYPRGIQTSSNLCILTMNPKADTPAAQLDIYTYSRSFVFDDLMDFFAVINKAAASALLPGEPVTYLDPKSILPPWLTDENSELIQKAFQKSEYFKKTAFCPAGIEPSLFRTKFPKLQMMSVGTNTENQHTINERVEIESIRRVSKAIQRLLAAD